MTQKHATWALLIITEAALIWSFIRVWDVQHVPAYVQILACGGLSALTTYPLGWLYRRVVHGAVAAWRYREGESERKGARDALD